MQPLAFVDLETTGATATSDRITEIGVVEVDEAGVREWSQLINPQARIPEFIERLTGISNAMVADAPAFGEVAEEVLTRLKGRLFIAHNARFDYGFLKNEFKRLGLDFRATVLCTVKLSRKLYPQHYRHNLDSLVERHSLTVHGDRHRALADARLIHQFWNHVHGDLREADIADAIKALTARPSLPAQLDPDLVHTLPEGPGVYLFYGENDLPLYVGKAKQLKKRVLSHFSADHASGKEMSLSQQVRRIDWFESAGELGALLKEAALVKSLQPTHNRHLRRNNELCAWRLVEQGGGHYVPELVFARDHDFGRRDNLYGLFKSPRDARRSLQGLAEEYGLCLAALGLEQTKPGKPCFAHQVHKCPGACVGKEPASQHSARLMAALGRLKVKGWPFPGPALIREGEEGHVVDGWCYLGTVRSDEEIAGLLENSEARFDHDTYKILVKSLPKMTPIAGA